MKLLAENTQTGKIAIQVNDNTDSKYPLVYIVSASGFDELPEPVNFYNVMNMAPQGWRFSNVKNKNTER